MATVNIFNSPYSDTQTWSSQGAIMNWTAGKKAISLPLVALGITINYQRAVNSFFPINTKGTNQGKKINVTGAPQGSLTITSIYSPDAKGLIEFLKAVSKDIKTASEQITLELHPFGTATNNATGQTINSVNHTLTLTGVEMASLQLSLNGGQAAAINFPTTYTFTKLSISDK